MRRCGITFLCVLSVAELLRSEWGKVRFQLHHSPGFHRLKAGLYDLKDMTSLLSGRHRLCSDRVHSR